MRKRNVLVLLVLLTTLVSFVKAEEPKKIGVTLDVTYVSKWLSKGVSAYGSKGGLFKTADIDLYGSGFGVKVTHRNAVGGGYVDAERFDFRPYYKNKLFEATKYQTNYNISVGYEYYPGLSRYKANTTYEWIYAFSWPNLLPYGLVPSYIAHYEYPAFSEKANHKNAGWVHRFLLKKDLDVPQFPNPVSLSTEVAFYDGLANRGRDWAYFTTGLTTKFALSKDIAFVPGVYHQISMEDKVNEDDVTYVQLSMKYVF